MRSYLILREKARRFAEDREIQVVLAELREADEAYTGPDAGEGYQSDQVQALRDYQFDIAALTERGRRYEELDQLLIELLLGVR
jgi:xylose isomerase